VQCRVGFETHASTTDPDARLYRRTHHGEAKLSYIGHLLIENRHGLIADARATRADGFGEREAGLWMLHVQTARAPSRRRTVGADKGYDLRDFVGCRARPGVHTACRAGRHAHGREYE